MSTTSASTARGPDPLAAAPVPPESLARDSARADLCRFLAACFYEPDPAFAEERLFDSLSTAAAQVHPDLAEPARRLGEAFAAQDLQTLLVDYTRLFLGSPHPLAAPYGSFWLDQSGALMQDSTMAALALYREGGFDVDPDLHELPDHAAVEFEFLYRLVFGWRQAQQAGDAGGAARIERLHRRFLDQHLGAWIGPFTEQLAAHAQTPFYRALADLAGRAVAAVSVLPPRH